MSQMRVLVFLTHAGAMRMRMRVKWPILATLLAVGIGYGAYPYITLYRLGAAIQGGNAKMLEKLVDWPAVREGIKEDICDLVVDDPTTRTATKLPPFGASFVRGIASGVIDRAVTPQALLAATSVLPEKTPSRRFGADFHVNWAFFESPTEFSVSLQMPGQAEPIKLDMDLRHGAWKIRRVWLPSEMLGNPAARA